MAVQPGVVWDLVEYPKDRFSHDAAPFFFSLQTLVLSVVFVEAVVVIIRQTNHFRVTRALRPMFLLDSYYVRGVRR